MPAYGEGPDVSTGTPALRPLRKGAPYRLVCRSERPPTKPSRRLLVLTGKVRGHVGLGESGEPHHAVAVYGNYRLSMHDHIVASG